MGVTGTLGVEVSTAAESFASSTEVVDSPPQPEKKKMDASPRRRGKIFM
jgi:hypothetical protein